MTMRTASATTFVSTTVADGEDELVTLARLRADAARNLQGEDGLRLVGVTRIEDRVMATFLREWQEKLPEPPAEPPAAERSEKPEA